MQKEDIKVTTTSNFEGIKINEYLQPITSHVVIGMNIFKDLMTSITDLIGGSSKTYEKTLTDINQKAISILKEKAFELGANCIIGLKIDNDEISANGKSMLMVTAVGTAAIGNFPKKYFEKEKTEENGIDVTVKNEKEEKELMEKYGISFYDEHYHFDNYKYNNLEDAVQYAELIESKKK